jgi:ATP-dependent phosphoenolpyruvate carboxykinase
MANNTHWSQDDLRKKGLIEVDNKASSQVAKKLDKLPLITVTGVNRDEALLQHPMCKKPTENRKIKNAVKVEIDGIKFDSRLEAYLHGLLTNANIHFEFQKEYILQNKFRYRGEAVRAVTLTVDFFLPIHGIIADSKGFQTQQGAIRWKMLKSVLKHLNDEEPEIVILKNKKECEAFVNRLLYDSK